MTEVYDRIGLNYAERRRPDPRIQRLIDRAIRGRRRVLNVGAGTGSYEPRNRLVVAVEPSITMIRQRPNGAAPVVQATAAALPFADGRFDAALAILTIHHWADWRRGLRELARAARRVVLLTWDPAAGSFWLTRDYFPELLAGDCAIFPSLDAIGRELGPIATQAVPIPYDCADGFLGAYWRRPDAYLKASVRAAISTFAKAPRLDTGLGRLRDDIGSGAWHRRNASILREDALDLGYRLVVAE